MSQPIYISAGHTAHSQFNTGIQRVTRSIARETLKANELAELLEWNIERSRYIILDDNARKKIAKYNGPAFVKAEDEFLALIEEIEAAWSKGREQGEAEWQELSKELASYYDFLSSDEPVRLYEATLKAKRKTQARLKLAWVGFTPLSHGMRTLLRNSIRSAYRAFIRILDKCEVWLYKKKLVSLLKRVKKSALAMNAYAEDIQTTSGNLELAVKEASLRIEQSMFELACWKKRMAFEKRLRSLDRSDDYEKSQEVLDDFRAWERSLLEAETCRQMMEVEAFLRGDSAIEAHENMFGSVDNSSSRPLEWVKWLPVTVGFRRRLRKWIRESDDFFVRVRNRAKIRKYVSVVHSARKRLDRVKRNAVGFNLGFFVDRLNGLLTGILELVSRREIPELDYFHRVGLKRSACLEMIECKRRNFETVLSQGELRVRESLKQAENSKKHELVESEIRSIDDLDHELALLAFSKLSEVSAPSESADDDRAEEFIRSEEAISQFEVELSSVDRFIHLPLGWVRWLPVPRFARRAIRKNLRDLVDWKVRRQDKSRIMKHVTQVHLCRKDLDATKRKALQAREGLLKSIKRVLAPVFEVCDCSRKYDELDTEIEGEFSVLKNPTGILASNQKYLDVVQNRMKPLSFKPQRGVWIVIPELMTESEMKGAIDYLEPFGVKIAVVFHDSIPLLHPEWVNDTIRENHRGYMSQMSRADCVLAVSEFSAECFRKFVKDEGIESPRVDVCLNAVSFSAKDRVKDLPVKVVGESIRILHIGTLEPRKNHKILLQAWRLFRERCPEVDAKLTLVGNPYSGFEDLAEWVRTFVEGDASIEWLGGVDDATVKRLYSECDFTVFPSLVEGFGLPILESIWYGRPCLTANFGAMAEVAREGGCLMVDTREVEALAEGFSTLALDEGKRLALAQECLAVPLRSWEDYVREMHALLAIDLDDCSDSLDA